MNELREARYIQLKALQNERLRSCYKDFSEQECYRAAANFFFGSVYTTDDTTRRDKAFQILTAQIHKVLGGDIITCMDTMIRLQKLTIELDLALLPQLEALQAPLLPPMDIYERAYAQMGMHGQRMQQIELTVNCMDLAWDIFRRFGVGTGLKALHTFMRIRGEALATGFLLEGYLALHDLPAIKPLSEAVSLRETARLERIFQLKP